MKHYDFKEFTAIVNGEEIRFKCHTNDTRNGFCHVVECMNYESANTKVSYSNRTWESFEYEIALSRAIDKLPKVLREPVRRQIIDGEATAERERAESMFAGFKRLHDGLNAENKARLASSGIEVQTEGDARAVMGLMAIMTMMQG